MRIDFNQIDEMVMPGMNGGTGTIDEVIAGFEELLNGNYNSFFIFIGWTVLYIKEHEFQRITLHEQPPQLFPYEQFTIDRGDYALEKAIREKMSMPERYEEVWNRVSEVLHSLEQWKGYSREDFDGLEIMAIQFALDILMADQGKIPNFRMTLGYSELCGIYESKNEKHQEYVEWIGRGVKEQGSDAHLVKQGLFGKNKLSKYGFFLEISNCERGNIILIFSKL